MRENLRYTVVSLNLYLVHKLAINSYHLEIFVPIKRESFITTIILMISYNYIMLSDREMPGVSIMMKLEASNQCVVYIDLNDIILIIPLMKPYTVSCTSY